MKAMGNIAAMAVGVQMLLAGTLAMGREGNGGPKGVFHTDVPSCPYSLILGRPTTQAVTLRVLASADTEGFVRYWKEAGLCSNVTATLRFKGGEPADVVIGSLDSNSRYRYQFCHRSGSVGVFTPGSESMFHTQRLPGSTFAFTITADSHLDENTRPAIYRQTLLNALSDKPDFHIDLGDTFMTDKRRGRPLDAFPQYLAQRYYFGQLCHSAPLFLVLGNHDGEFGGRIEDATRMRKTYFPNPEPDTFYTGSANENYYAWEWGDALFVVVDPYRYSRANKGGSDPWGMTLGKTQYDWLARTLRHSTARFKFIFIHQLVGGLDKAGRGGVEAASLYEWGGHEKGGKDTFATNRPGWEKPIHALLVETGVSAVFHGHDHFFAHQELDGIVYQLVPQPGHPGEGSVGQASNYGYCGGDSRPGTGYLRVRVSSTGTAVEFVRTTPADDNRTSSAGSVACRYTIPANTKGKIP